MKTLTATKVVSEDFGIYWNIADEFGGLGTYKSINEVCEYAVDHNYQVKVVR